MQKYNTYIHMSFNYHTQHIMSLHTQFIGISRIISACKQLIKLSLHTFRLTMNLLRAPFVLFVFLLTFWSTDSAAKVFGCAHWAKGGVASWQSVNAAHTRNWH